MTIFRCCVESFDIFPTTCMKIIGRARRRQTVINGVWRVVGGGRAVSVQMTVLGIARFSDTPQLNLPPICQCSCCQFRQAVEGKLTIEGVKIPMRIGPGRPLLENVWQEDGDPITGAPYGHRDRPQLSTDVYSHPDRADGCQYAMIDTPGVADMVPGIRYDLDLRFVSLIVDFCEQVVRLGDERFWTVRCQGVA